MRPLGTLLSGRRFLVRELASVSHDDKRGEDEGAPLGWGRAAGCAQCSGGERGAGLEHMLKCCSVAAYRTVRISSTLSPVSINTSVFLFAAYLSVVIV